MFTIGNTEIQDIAVVKIMDKIENKIRELDEKINKLEETQ